MGFFKFLGKIVLPLVFQSQSFYDILNLPNNCGIRAFKQYFTQQAFPKNAPNCPNINLLPVGSVLQQNFRGSVVQRRNDLGIFLRVMIYLFSNSKISNFHYFLCPIQENIGRFQVSVINIARMTEFYTFQNFLYQELDLI